MKLLFSIVHLSDGGAERALSLLCNALVRHGVEVGIVIGRKTANEYELDTRVKIFRNDGIFNKLFRHMKIIKEFNPDYIIPFLLPYTVHMFLANILFKNNLIYCVRNNPWTTGNLKEKLKQLLADFIAKKSHKIMVQNETQKQYYSKSIQEKVFILPNIIDNKFMKKDIFENHGINTIITTGRLHFQKNQKLFITMAAEVLKTHPKLQFKIYGVGELEQELQNLIERLGVQNNVALMGRSNAMWEEYAKADVFVLTSDYEGMPNSLLEAMSMGLICISTDCETGPKEIIQDGVNGFLVPCNEVLALRDAVFEVILNKNIRKKISDNGTQISKNHSSEAIANSFLRNIDTNN